ncbi:hypothetical protein KUCAC02_012526 [Chaenocephalus aceratus]|uniref:Uncharacterized protein n=1 Tax=Chaenocephalus aceratus TaxID=36190 RepID=A0ACB9XCV8_CHAAC|nr:hypothetical protein KUCAC02_012526 [Chaenocephalus aceratus]
MSLPPGCQASMTSLLEAILKFLILFQLI